MNLRNARNYLLLSIIVLGILELLGYGLLFVANGIAGEPIKRKADLYREQSEHIDRWIEMDGRGRDVVDRDLGWIYRAGFANDRNQMNSQGLRSTHEYSVVPATGILRVAAFGDSFVYGNEVVNQSAWASIVETLYDDIEVLNYGIGGYGLDQALLRYEREGSALAPHIVIMGFIADDLRRVTNVYQRFALANAGIFTKPRFRLVGGDSLELIPGPISSLEDWLPIRENPAAVQAWGANDQWYEPVIYVNPLYDYSSLVRLASTIWIRLENRYFDPNRIYVGETFNKASEAYRIQMKIFERFAADVRANGARPVILIMPSRGELVASLEGRDHVYKTLLPDLSARGLDYIDATDAFLAAPREPSLDPWFAPGGHYSPVGNRIVAVWLGETLLEMASGPSD